MISGRRRGRHQRFLHMTGTIRLCRLLLTGGPPLRPSLQQQPKSSQGLSQQWLRSSHATRLTPAPHRAQPRSRHAARRPCCPILGKQQTVSPPGLPWTRLQRQLQHKFYSSLWLAPGPQRSSRPCHTAPSAQPSRRSTVRSCCSSWKTPAGKLCAPIHPNQSTLVCSKQHAGQAVHAFVCCQNACILASQTAHVCLERSQQGRHSHEHYIERYLLYMQGSAGQLEGAALQPAEVPSQQTPAAIDPVQPTQALMSNTPMSSGLSIDWTARHDSASSSIEHAAVIRACPPRCAHPGCPPWASWALRAACRCTPTASQSLRPPAR